MPAISTKDYAVGDLICTEMPFVKVVAKNFKSNHCDNCLCKSSETVTLKKCTACMNMHYCSKSCQEEDWKAGHKYECKFYKRYYSDLEQVDPRILLRLHFLLKDQKELAFRKVNLQYDESVKISFDDLEKVIAEKNHLMTRAFHYYLSIFHKCKIFDYDPSTLFEYFSKQARNLLSVFSKYDCVAHGIYMSPSVFGHSCVPNATRSFNACRLDIRAIKEIKKGEPITASVARVDTSIPLSNPHLKNTYIINCSCSRCISIFEQKFDYETMARLDLEINKAEHMDQQLDKAFQVGKQLIPLYKHLCGYDITVSWHLMRMAELYKKMPIVELDSGVGQVLEDTVKHVKVTHGVDHPLYKEYLQLLEEYQESKGEIKK